jgi:GAF domain-containing protein
LPVQQGNQSNVANDFEADLAAIDRIQAMPTILEVVCRTTGMGFAAVARVTEDRWIACAVRDDIQFGLKPRGELKVETTICHEIRQAGTPVIINHVAADEHYCGHHTPVTYGFESYISVPIVLQDGTFFGTLCAIDPRPARLNTPEPSGAAIRARTRGLATSIKVLHLAPQKVEWSGTLPSSPRRQNDL